MTLSRALPQRPAFTRRFPRRNSRIRSGLRAIACLASLAAATLAVAQSDSGASVSNPVSASDASQTPAAPTPQQMQVQHQAQQKAQQKALEQEAEQTKRILGIIPNFRAVSSNQKLPPQSARDKFLTATDDSFDYSSIFIPAGLAGYSMARRAYPEFGNGAQGYANYFWHSAVDQTTENYMVEFVVPVLTHEDTRYYTLGHGGFVKRAGYAISRSVVTRTDHAQTTFNFSEVFGAGASAALSNAYYPAQERTFGNTATTWGLDVAIDSASMFIKEFWPDVNRRFKHRVNSPAPVQ